MNTKECPYCHEEISEDAILCKYCHNLLTDDDDEPTMVFKPDQEDDERTRVFSASDAVRSTREPSNTHNDEYDDEEYDDEEYDDEEYDDDEYDDDEYDDDDEYEDDDDYDDSSKRTFITAAVITLGILLIIIIAIVAGYKIFGSSDDDKTPSLSTSMIQNDNSKGDTSAKPADASMNDESKGGDTSEDESSKDDTSSQDDTSSEAESSSVPDSSSAPDSSSKEESSSTNEDSSSNSDSSSTAEVPADADKIIAKATEILSSHNNSGVKSFTYREEDSKNTAMEYYYILTNDNKNYSVAYNTNNGKCIVAGGGERYEG